MSDRLEDIIKFRKDKLETIEKLGFSPYPSTCTRTHTIAEALRDFDALAEHSTEVSIVGRIRSFRDMGQLIFAHLEDGTGRMQVFFKKDECGEEILEFFKKNFDIGDFAGVTGILFTTKTGEKTLLVKLVEMLAKSLLPLPSEHFGLEDEEKKLRQRYLDLLMNSATRDIFVKKARFWGSMRKFLEERGFLHIDMPILESVPGGAEARPFITHHNALDKDFYLRISLELPLKKALVGGFEKVFEIGRIFRNEGISTEHLQDYTQMEFYWAYADFSMLQVLLQEMYQYVLQETFGTLQISARGQMCDWSGEWERVSYIELFSKHTGIDLLTAPDDELKQYCDEHHITYESFAQRGRLIDLIFKTIRKTLPSDKPIFLVDQPVELEPLAKRDPSNPKLVQRLQIVAYGTELGKGFGELNDPVDQKSRFAEQQALREQGDDEAQMLDSDFVEALEYGMPPAAGFGLSERLFAVLMDRSIRETVVFPLMK